MELPPGAVQSPGSPWRDAAAAVLPLFLRLASGAPDSFRHLGPGSPRSQAYVWAEPGLD